MGNKSKSVRSKHCKKMRAIKRERYAKKELDKLIQVVQGGQIDQNMVELVTAEELLTGRVRPTEEEEMMDTDNTTCGKRIPTRKGLSKGKAFPTWMNQRKIRKIVRSHGRSKKGPGKKGGSKKNNKRK